MRIFIFVIGIFLLFNVCLAEEAVGNFKALVSPN